MNHWLSVGYNSLIQSIKTNNSSFRIFNYKPLLLILLLTITINVFAQEDPTKLLVVSYNVENLFDTLDDHSTDDNQYLPESELKWTESRYINKINHVSWVISTIGEWSYPDLVGLVEIENKEVVEALIQHNNLCRAHYRHIVSKGADPRGVDVALLWRPESLKLLQAKEIPHYDSLLFYPLGNDHRSLAKRNGTGRNTLWATFRDECTKEEIEVFVVHAPSRRGGTLPTQKDRIRVMEKLRKVINRLQLRNPHSRIIIMGDFNDNPANISLRRSLQALPIEDATKQLRPDQLYNLASTPRKQNQGTHYFQGRLWMPDHFIVSGSLLSPDSSLFIPHNALKIFTHKAITEENGSPRRTYKGTYHQGGYSDHFPIYLKIERRQPCTE